MILASPFALHLLADHFQHSCVFALFARLRPGSGQQAGYQACDDGHHRHVLSSARPGPLQGAESNAPYFSKLLRR